MMVLATPEHREEVLYGMTEWDRRSIAALRGIDDVPGLVRSFATDCAADLLFTFAWLDEEGRPAAFVGAAQAGNIRGVREVWSVATPRLTRAHGFRYTRACERMCRGLLATGHCRRLSAWSMVGHPTSARWLIAMKFFGEGYVNRLGMRGETFKLYGRWLP